MRSFVYWFLGSVVGLVMLLAGVGKALWPEDTLQVLAIVGLPDTVAGVIVTLVPAAEVALALALIVGWRSRLLYALTAFLLVVFAGFLQGLSLVDPTSKCSCFGPLVTEWTGGGTIQGIVRNGLLLILILIPWWHLRHLESVPQLTGGESCEA
jgi:hypothetical protein